MLYTFNFSVEHFSNIIDDTIECRGIHAIKQDANLLYYYLTQKYSHSEIKEVMTELDTLLELPEKEICEKISFLADKNHETTIPR